MEEKSQTVEAIEAAIREAESRKRDAVNAVDRMAHNIERAAKAKIAAENDIAQLQSDLVKLKTPEDCVNAEVGQETSTNAPRASTQALRMEVLTVLLQAFGKGAPDYIPSKELLDAAEHMAAWVADGRRADK